LRKHGTAKLAHQSRRFVCRHNQRIKVPTVPFCDGAIRLNKIRFPQIQEQPFILGGNDFVTPVMRFCFVANVAPEKHKSVAVIAISEDDFGNCVATRDQNRED
jgi:hypothetical protein